MQIKHLREGGVRKARFARRLGVLRQTASNLDLQVFGDVNSNMCL